MPLSSSGICQLNTHFTAITVPHRRRRGCSLSGLQITENNLSSSERARVEHVSCLYGNVSSVIKFVTTCAHFLGKYAERHLMFSGRRYREDLSLLGVFVGTTINANALCIRMGYGRRSGNGPRAHGIYTVP